MSPCQIFPWYLPKSLLILILIHGMQFRPLALIPIYLILINFSRSNAMISTSMTFLEFTHQSDILPINFVFAYLKRKNRSYFTTVFIFMNRLYIEFLLPIFIILPFPRNIKTQNWSTLAT